VASLFLAESEGKPHTGDSVDHAHLLNSAKVDRPQANRGNQLLNDLARIAIGSAEEEVTLRVVENPPAFILQKGGGQGGRKRGAPRHGDNV
jgi:hypothetical protein